MKEYDRFYTLQSGATVFCTGDSYLDPEEIKQLDAVDPIVSVTYKGHTVIVNNGGR